jgi:hypothetical protein
VKFPSTAKQVLFTLGTAAATAGVRFATMPPHIAIIGLIALVVHEFGHYFAALYTGANPRLPMFLPLPFITVGFTFIFDISNGDEVLIAIAGTIAAILFLSGVAITAFLLSNSSLGLMVLILIAMEIINMIIGSDGKKFRAARDKEKFNNGKSNGFVYA